MLNFAKKTGFKSYCNSFVASFIPLMIKNLWGQKYKSEDKKVVPL